MALRQTLPRAQWNPAHFYNLNKKNKEKRISTVRRYPIDAILHWDADSDTYDSNAFTELTGGPHTFNHAVLSPQYQRNADGSYANVGAKPAVDTFDGEKWLRSCGAVTNLLASGAADFTHAAWTRRGAISVLLVDGWYLLNNLTERNDAYTSAFGAGGAPYSVCFDLKQHGASGVLSIENPHNRIYGRWLIDLSKIPVGGERITDAHPAVTVVVPMVLSEAGFGGIMIKGISGPATISVYIRNPQVTLSAYPVPYTPPGTTMPASNATTTNGSWFTLPDGSPLWQVLDGKPDGVELVDLTSAIVNDHSGSIGSYDGETKTLSNTGIGTNQSFPRFWFEMGAKTVGARYRCSFVFSDTEKMHTVRLAISGSTQNLTKTGNVFSGTITADNTYNKVEIQLDGRFIFSTQIISATIQRIQPQPLTLATRVRMGVGSGDIPLVTVLRALDPSGSGAMQYVYENGVGEPTAGFNGKNHTIVSLSRGSIIRLIGQVNTAGTQFRSGYYLEGTSTAISWSDWAAYTGTLNPSTLYRLMLGFNNAYPMWYNKITAWKKQATDAEILEAMA